VPTVAVNGIDVYYERAGEGPRLLFFNGSGSTLRTSALLIKPFTERFDVVAHDQRGLGDTSIPPGPYSMADYAADAAGLLDAVKWDRCRVVGVSFGGMVAQEFAVTWPERVERLALVCTSPGGVGGASYPLHELGSLPPRERAAKGTQLLDTRFTPEWLASHDGDRMLAEMMAQRAAGAKSDEQLRGEAEQLDARRRHDVCDRLAQVSCPTLVAAGRYDGIAPVANAEAIASRVPQAQLRCYEGGHAFFAQDPAALPDILDFLAQP
jgi:pimeloyl-ACP methyl ester carboxylesterase